METSDRLLLNNDDDDGHALASPGVHLPRLSLTPTFSNSTDTLFFATSRIHLHRVSLPKPDGAHARTVKNEQQIQLPDRTSAHARVPTVFVPQQLCWAK
ncbi:hypothetical protein VTO73DRAFT_8745 [Trametes versicolor]